MFFQTEMRELQERLQLEKDAWEENYKKKHDTWLMQKERELKEHVRKERDKEIEVVITRLEEDACLAREESDKVAEAKLRSVGIEGSLSFDSDGLVVRCPGPK